MISKYWYEEGKFLDISKNKYLFKKDDKEFDFCNYLHGFCDIFVIKLFEFGKEHNITYPISVILTNEGLIHAFCWLESPEEEIDYFIDVRGITSSKQHFFEEFKDLFNYNVYFSDEYYEDEDNCDFYGYIETFYSLEDYLNFVKDYFDDEEYFQQEDILQESKNILETFKENYLLPDWISKEIEEL